MGRTLYRVVDGRGVSTVTDSESVAKDLVTKTINYMSANIDVDNDFVELQSVDLDSLEQPIIWEDLLSFFLTDVAWIPEPPVFGDSPIKWEKVVRHV